MGKVLLFSNPDRDAGLAACGAVARILGDLGREYAVCTDARTLAELDRDAPLCVAFGGDGTILHAARALCRAGTPILGVNLGHTGFMAELEAGELELVRQAFEGRFTLEERMMADVTAFRDGQAIFRDFALNEAVLGGVSRVVGVNVYGDGRRIMGFSGDGVIVSTPTGSTAYSMSAGGPIVEPSASSLVVTPVCPHVLSARSYVLSPERTVTLEVRSLGGKSAYLSVDGGQALDLTENDRIEVRKSRLITRLVRITGRSFYDKVNRKLGDHA